MSLSLFFDTCSESALKGRFLVKMQFVYCYAFVYLAVVIREKNLIDR